MSRPSIDEFVLLTDFEHGMDGSPVEGASVRASRWEVVDDAAQAYAGSRFLRWTGDARPPGEDEKAPFVPQKFYFDTQVPGTGARQELRVLATAKVSTGRDPVTSSGVHQCLIGVEQYAADGALLQTDLGAPVSNFPPYRNSSVGWGGAFTQSIVREDAAYCRIFAEVQGGATSAIDLDFIRYAAYPYVDYGPGVPLPDSGGVTVSPGGVVVRPSAPTREFKRAKLPRAGESFVNAQGKPAQPFYTWASAVDKTLGGVAALADEAKAVVEALPRQLGSPDGTVGRIPRITPTVVKATVSLQALPTSDGYSISLRGDADAPGPMHVYGTGTAGQRGWQPLADGFVAGRNVSLAADEFGRVVVSAGEILVADGASPPVMLTDDAETDFLYEG